MHRSWTALKAAVDARFQLQGSRAVSPAPAMLEAQDGRYLPPDDRRSFQEFEAKLERLARRLARHSRSEEGGLVSVFDGPDYGCEGG